MQDVMGRPATSADTAAAAGSGQAFALGWACGGRTSFGPVALVLSAARTGSRLSRWRSIGALCASAGEMVVDKLPTTPSRLKPEALSGRVLVGAASAGYLAHRGRRPLLVAAGFGAAGAVAGSLAGNLLRRLAARTAPDWKAAVAEDIVTAAVASWAVRRSSSRPVLVEVA